MSEPEFDAAIEAIVSAARDAARSLASRAAHGVVLAIPVAEGRPRPPVPVSYGDPPAEPEYPPPREQAANLARAVGRAARAAVTGGRVLASEAMIAARTAACLACPHNGERTAGGIRCTICGCGAGKLHLATERCPADPPRWDAWEDPC